jgi:hypothetical protein
MSYNPNNSELDAELFGGYVPGQKTIHVINDEPSVDLAYVEDTFGAIGYFRWPVIRGRIPLKGGKKLSVDGRDPYTVENLRPMPDSVLSLVERDDLPSPPEDFRDLDPAQCLKAARAILSQAVIDCESTPLIPQQTVRSTQNEDPALTHLRQRMNSPLRRHNIDSNAGMAA